MKNYSPSSDTFIDLISSIAASVQKEVKKIPPLRKHLSGHYSQETFSASLSFVAHGIRTGYLLDLFTPKDPVDLFSRLLSALRSDLSSKESFDSVVHVFEPCSEQSFFINVKRLDERIQKFSSGSPPNNQEYPVFIYLGSPIKLLEGPPDDVVQLLKRLLPLVTTSQDPLPVSYSLPTYTAMESAVPLAGMLLDYPAAYCPSLSHKNVLSGLPLDFYECNLDFGKGRQENGDRQDNKHTIMNFSCLSQIACREDDDRLIPERIISELKKMYTGRLDRFRDDDMEISVVHAIRVLHHVTF